MSYQLPGLFVKYYSGDLVRRERMRFMNLHCGIEIRNNVSIEVQNLFAITKRLEIRVSEVNVKIPQSVVQGVAGSLKKLSTNWLGTPEASK